MSIHCNAGKPGAGKSYHSTLLVRDAVETGRHVVTNLPLKLDHPFWMKAKKDGLLTQFEPTVLEMGMEGKHLGSLEGWAEVMDKENKPLLRNIKVKGGATSELGPLVVVDEAASTFEKMVEQQKKRDDWNRLLEFFRLHRHSKSDIIFCVQDYMQTPHQLKGLVEKWHEIRNTTENWGVSKTGTYAIYTYQKGGLMGSSSHSDKKTGTFKKDTFDLYDSFAMGAAEGGGKIEGKRLWKNRPLWMRPSFLVMMLSLAMLPIVLIWFAFTVQDAIWGAEEVSMKTNETPSTTGDIVSNAGASPSRINIADRLSPDQLPEQSVAFLGYDRHWLYFADGSRISSIIHLPKWEMEVVYSSPCRLVLRGVDDRPGGDTEITYACARGF